MRHYDPDTGTESLDGTGTAETDMPAASREWFQRAANDGFIWQTDQTGTYPVEVPRPDPTPEQRAISERVWLKSELDLTDRYVLPDFPITDEDRQLIKEYRTALRTAGNGYPSSGWRPVFPVSVTRDD